MTGLPGWYSEAERRWLRKQQGLQAAANAAVLARPIADSFATAPGWRDMGMELVLGEDPAYPRDPMVTKAIQVFDPKLVPLWCRWGFMPPGTNNADAVVIFGRHAVGRWVDSSQGQKEMVLRLVNQVEFIWEGTIFGQRDKRSADLPGAYLPWDWRLYSFCRENYSFKSVADLKEQFISKPKEEKQKRQEKQAEELAYVQKDLEKFVNKKLEEAGEVEMKNHFLGGSE